MSQTSVTQQLRILLTGKSKICLSSTDNGDLLIVATRGPELTSKQYHRLIPSVSLDRYRAGQDELLVENLKDCIEAFGLG